MSRCRGCGITLQNNDKTLLGYTPNIKNDYCERCFRTIHYNEEIKIKSIDNNKIINKINKLNIFTIFITDFLSLNKDVIAVLKKIKSPKILVINKCDLIPDNLKLEHLEENIKRVYNLDCDVLFISAKNKMYLKPLKDLIAYFKEVIFCGETSSGKSTLINDLFLTKITTSKYQNTTLDFIKIKKDNLVIYDTPGIILNNKESIEKINVLIKKLNKDYYLNIGDIKLNGDNNITIYTNKEVKSKKDNEELAYKININKPTDILFDGGFIFVKDKGIIKVNNLLEVRDSIIK